MTKRVHSVQRARGCLVQVWGLGSDTTKDPGPWEGELRNMWKPTQVPPTRRGHIAFVVNPSLAAGAAALDSRRQPAAGSILLPLPGLATAGPARRGAHARLRPCPRAPRELMSPSKAMPVKGSQAPLQGEKAFGTKRPMGDRAIIENARRAFHSRSIFYALFVSILITPIARLFKPIAPPPPLAMRHA